MPEIHLYTAADGHNELSKTSIIANFATTAADGKIYQVDYYNLNENRID